MHFDGINHLTSQVRLIDEVKKMCKAVGTDRGRFNWVVLKKPNEIKAAQALDFQVTTHPTLGDVVPCDGYNQAEVRARQIRVNAPMF